MAKEDKKYSDEFYVYATYHEKVSKKSSLEDSQKYREYRRKWEEYPRTHKVADFPIHLDIESTSACNLKCPMCFQTFNPPEKGFMKMELFRKLIDEGISKGLCSIKLNFRGEPLLHPDVVEMVRYAKKKGIIEVMFNTNATLLTEDMSRKLIDAGLDKLLVSFEGYTKEDYESIRRGATFEKTVGNVKRFQEIKREMGLDRPVVRVQMVLLRRWKDKPEDFVKKYTDFWSRIVDHVAVEDENEWDYTKNTGDIVYSDFRCPQPWQRLFVRWDGKITMCCGDLYGEMVLGDANKVTIESVWKSKKMEGIRELLKKGESHRIPLCQKCGARRTIIEQMKRQAEGKSK